MAVVNPCTLLALFATILCLSTTATLGKLSCVPLPFATLVVCALTDVTTGFVFAAEVSHNHASPVIDIRMVVVAHGELFDQRENVIIIWLAVFLIVVIFRLGQRHIIGFARLAFSAISEFWNEMSLLEIRPETGIL